MNEILIIDDDQQLGLSFAKILSQEGYTPAMVYTAREGIESILLGSVAKRVVKRAHCPVPCWS